MKRLAELKQVKLNDDSAIQYITDSMANNLLIQIEYEGSGWRTVQPYSFTTSQDNNLLVMCYKADGSIRSYRFDRIEQLFVDSVLMETHVEDVKENENKADLKDFEIPYLPEYDEILEMSENEQGEPFQDGLDALEQGENFQPQILDEEGNPIEESNIDNIDETDEADSTPLGGGDTEDMSLDEENKNVEEISSDESNEVENSDNETDDIDIDLDSESEESNDDIDINLDEESEKENG